MFADLLPKMGIEVRFVDGTDPKSFATQVDDKTRAFSHCFLQLELCPYRKSNQETCFFFRKGRPLGSSLHPVKEGTDAPIGMSCQLIALISC